ncbi:hypothetical protein [Hymenobacter weizhouensis]|uniref:hypothetical protein n=1 Tax=Hymenobacter sp. YIM 151500-1 TaxID=2987689 RepID=UPI0022274B66|nr:hypothetical protein [Hymenobacter sp. YIM 151500-1]UYZ64122.1 hypothetical protein OIS53_04560 [Hymenobacter sp. YIM 151500-1]
MRVLDIIRFSPQETFLIGYPTGPVQAGSWELRCNGELVATLDVTGEAELEAGRRGKLAPPRAVVCRGPVDKSRFDFTRDEVTLERVA